MRNLEVNLLRQRDLLHELPEALAVVTNLELGQDHHAVALLLALGTPLAVVPCPSALSSRSPRWRCLLPREA